MLCLPIFWSLTKLAAGGKEIMQVLLIDDDSVTHQIIGVFLERYGRECGSDVSVKALHDPVQGLLELSDNGIHYDLILLDLRLPKLSGDEIYRSISKNAPELMERIIFITASPEKLHDKLPERDLRVLGKPFRYELFAFHVADVLQSAPQSNVVG